EVLHERLLVLIASLPAADLRPAAPLAATLTAEMDAARTRLLETMSTRRYYDLVDRLVEAASRPALVEAADSPAAQVLPDLVRRPWRRLRQAVRALDERPPDEELHRVRILAKRVRYPAVDAADERRTAPHRQGRRRHRLQTRSGRTSRDCGRPPAAAGRLDAAEGQARRGRDGRAGGAARGPGGDRPAVPDHAAGGLHRVRGPARPRQGRLLLGDAPAGRPVRARRRGGRHALADGWRG